MTTPFTSSRSFQRFIAFAIAAAIMPFATAGDFPEKTIRLSVDYPAGGLSDVVARKLAEKVAVTLKVPVVVENRPGAGGTINIAEVSRARPDGYTLAFSATSPLTLTPYFSKVSYTPEKAVTPVIGVMYSPVVLLGTQALKAKDFNGFIDAAKQAPGSMRWATSGMGTIGHIMFGQISHDAGLDMNLIPYKGGSQQMNDALGGQFEIFSTNVSATLIENIKAGKLHALAIGADERIEGLSDVPTFTELGQPKANLKSNFGIVAPAGTPNEVIEILNKAFDAALHDPQIAESLRQSGNIPSGGKAEQFQRVIEQESRNNRAIIEQAGLAAQ
ncbi:ABC transporter substrate-binding protein [Advenella sp. S44]|nr:ABC transporter substrate-binding protein [Advenella sp. S44]